MTKRREVTPYDWRKTAVQMFDAQLEVLITERDKLNLRIDGILALREANMAVKLKRLKTAESAQSDEPKPKTCKRHKVVHWSKRPGVSPKKIAAWKKQMALNAQGRRKK